MFEKDIEPCTSGKLIAQFIESIKSSNIDHCQKYLNNFAHHGIYTMALPKKFKDEINFENCTQIFIPAINKKYKTEYTTLYCSILFTANEQLYFCDINTQKISPINVNDQKTSKILYYKCGKTITFRNGMSETLQLLRESGIKLNVTLHQAPEYLPFLTYVREPEILALLIQNNINPRIGYFPTTDTRYAQPYRKGGILDMKAASFSHVIFYYAQNADYVKLINIDSLKRLQGQEKSLPCTFTVQRQEETLFDLLFNKSYHSFSYDRNTLSFLLKSNPSLPIKKSLSLFLQALFESGAELERPSMNHNLLLLQDMIAHEIKNTPNIHESLFQALQKNEMCYSSNTTNACYSNRHVFLLIRYAIFLTTPPLEESNFVAIHKFNEPRWQKSMLIAQNPEFQKNFAKIFSKESSLKNLCTAFPFFKKQCLSFLLVLKEKNVKIHKYLRRDISLQSFSYKQMMMLNNLCALSYEDLEKIVKNEASLLNESHDQENSLIRN